jgi:ribosome-binding factor A
MSRRTARIAEAIRETVSTTVLFELRDPRIKNVTVISVDVSPDIRSAKVYVSIMGDEKAQSLALHGLESARGFLQARVADRIETRYTPILKFVIDPGVKKSIEASRLLREVLPPQEEPANESAEADTLEAEDNELAGESEDRTE